MLRGEKVGGAFMTNPLVMPPISDSLMLILTNCAHHNGGHDGGSSNWQITCFHFVWKLDCPVESVRAEEIPQWRNMAASGPRCPRSKQSQWAAR